MKFDPYSRFHGKIDVTKIVPGYKPIIPRLSKEGTGRLTASHHRATNMVVPNLLTGDKQKRENPLPTEFKSILEVSTRCPYCPISFVLDVNMGYCGMGCIPKGFYVETKYGSIDISKLKKGDIIKSFDIKSKSLVESEVVFSNKRKADRILEIELENGENLKLTPDHPIYTKRGWVEAKDVRKDDEVLFL